MFWLIWISGLLALTSAVAFLNWAVGTRNRAMTPQERRDLEDFVQQESFW